MSRFAISSPKDIGKSHIYPTFILSVPWSIIKSTLKWVSHYSHVTYVMDRTRARLGIGLGLSSVYRTDGVTVDISQVLGTLGNSHGILSTAWN